MRLFLFISLVTVSFGGSCLDWRRQCLRSSECRPLFQKFKGICGYSLTRCESSASDCVFLLRHIRQFLPYDCYCQEADHLEQCDYFRQLVWNHPCERRIKDAHARHDFREHPLSATTEPTAKRTTRTPLSDQVLIWKNQLHGELETRSVLSEATCDEALHGICLQHVSCRQLWRLFRQSCGVDAENKCIMTDKEVCWQSFEGLSWTGLDNCRCETNSSDCHFIRLQTNYNKCIYEMSKSREFGSRFSSSRAKYGVQYQQRYEGVFPTNTSTASSRDRKLEEQRKEEQERKEREREKEIENEKKQREQERVERQRQRERLIEQERIRQQQREREQREWERKNKEHEIERQRAKEREKQREREREIEKAREAERQRILAMTTTTTTTTTSKPPLSPARIQVQYRPPMSTQSKISGNKRKKMKKPSQENPYTLTASGRSGARDGQEQTSSETEESMRYHPLKGKTNSKSQGYYHYTTHPPRVFTYPTPKTTVMETALDKPLTRTSTKNDNTPSVNSFAPKQLWNENKSTRMESKNELHRTWSSETPGSTCVSAFAACEASEDCRWNLGELRVRCGRACRKDDCAMAVQRFSRYVSRPHLEATMFCHCKPGDSECSRLQNLLYSKCLYTVSGAVPTCSEVANKCDADPRCRQQRQSLESHCPVSDGVCTASKLQQCRATILLARATLLEQPCSCSLSDTRCISHLKIMLPNNPCIEKAMVEYALSEETESEQESIKVSETQRSRDRNSYPSYEPVEEQATMAAVWPTVAQSTTPQPNERSRSKHRTTISPPPPTNRLPPWITTTTAATTTTTFVTQAPPPPEGCTTRDATGRSIFVHLRGVVRLYTDWSSQCSAWCECTGEEELVCSTIPCLPPGQCQAPLTLVDFGERIYLKDRGACFCESSHFICELPEEMPELYPGVYIIAAYSQSDVDHLREKVSQVGLEKAGFLAREAAADISHRLQVAFERILPPDLPCRVVLVPALSEPGSAFLRVEWFGMNPALNHTMTKWYHGAPEKVCSPYVRRMSELFEQADSFRYQLVLSTVKQLKILDYLDGLPSSAYLRPALSLIISLFISNILLLL